MIKKHDITVMIIVIFSLSGLTSCVSFYCSGQLGHEMLNVQAPDIRVEKQSYSQLAFSLEADVISSLFIDGDGAYNFQGALQYSQVNTINDSATVQFTGGISGWGGTTILDTVRFPVKTIPDGSPYYGGSVMGAAALDHHSGTYTAGGGIETMFSYEDGPYGDLREVLHQQKSYYGDSYKNLSPSGLTMSVLLFDRFTFGIGEDIKLGLSTYVGLGYPNLLNLLKNVALAGGSVSAAFRDITFYLAYEHMVLLNSSFSVGVMKRFF